MRSVRCFCWLSYGLVTTLASGCSSVGDLAGERKANTIVNHGICPADGGATDSGSGESANCTVLTSATGSIVDAAGNVWTLATGPDGSLIVNENGSPAAFTDQVIELAYVGQVVWQENVNDDWWSWASGAWNAGSDPATACTGDAGGANADSGSTAPDAAGGPIFTAGAGEQAQQADAFVDTIGANTHFTFGGTNWDTDRDSLIIPGLAQMGIRHLRDGLDLSDTSAYPIYADVYNTVQASTGTVVSFNLLMPYPSQYGNCNLGDVNVSIVLGSIPVANIESFEGINEWNGFSANAGLSCGNAWQSDLQTSQPALYAAVKGNPQLSAIPVLGPSLAFFSGSQLQSDASSVGDLSGSMDFGAEHSYPGGQMPSTNIMLYHTSVAPMDGSDPFTVTESGYYTMPDGQQGISETAHGKYMSRFFLEYFNAGSARTYVYDLINDADGAGTDQGNFGMMRNDGSFKPGATAVQDEIALLGDLGPSFTPGQLNYSLGNAPSQVHHTLLQKRSGVMYLLLWQEVDSYDTTNQVDLSVAPVSVNVDLGQSFSTVNQYDPVVGATPLASSNNIETLTVSVADEVLVLEIQP